MRLVTQRRNTPPEPADHHSNGTEPRARARPRTYTRRESPESLACFGVLVIAREKDVEGLTADLAVAKPARKGRSERLHHPRSGALAASSCQPSCPGE